MKQINSDLKIHKKQLLKADDIFAELKLMNRTALSQAITLVESKNLAHRSEAEKLLSKCLKEKNKTVRIGITGVPGVGKSSFIEAFGLYLTNLGKRVAVLAVDPSSERSGGSILGDKTRMNKLALEENAFIRPSPSSNSLGGVTQVTRETIILCEAAGFDVILVETVGVGQSETAVYNMVDYFMLLMIAGAGDELQGIKRGIMEMADGFVVTKSDGDNILHTEQTKREVENAVRFFPALENNWQPSVFLSSALKAEGISNIWQDIEHFCSEMQMSKHFAKRRSEQELRRFEDQIKLEIEASFFASEENLAVYKTAKGSLAAGKLSAYEAVAQVLSKLK